ncbi:hypothetical protein H4R99_008296, partial [Coemansia sp. RSA 1722]
MEEWKLGWKAIGPAQQDASMAGSAEQNAGLLFCSLAAWPSASPAGDPVLLSGIVLPTARQAPGLVCETWALLLRSSKTSIAKLTKTMALLAASRPFKQQARRQRLGPQQG